MSNTPKDACIFISGIAGLVGQNLALRLIEQGFTNICGVDKHKSNLETLRGLHPTIDVLLADIAEPGVWSEMVYSADVVIINQAQIGGLDYSHFYRNNVIATRNILGAINVDKDPYIIQISSSVVNSEADDFYTRSKTEQEDIVRGANINGVILRPTLMFGWFDRKHLGWLRRFMSKVPVFPVPGNGKFRRQPLYVGDFSNIIMACMRTRPVGEIYNISGLEIIDYIDLIRIIKTATKESTLILRIPYYLFFALLWVAGKILKDPPFTIHQLRALIIPETFEMIDWPEMFGVRQTPFSEAVDETFNHPVYSKVELDF